MINIFVGWLLLLIPFLLIFCWPDRLRGFIYILVAASAFHLVIALTTQFFHIFSYPLILILNIIMAGTVIFLLIKRAKKISFKIKFNWLILLAFGIIILELGSVHYFYSGSASTIDGYQMVDRISYPYPYFSDEWIGVALTNHSIASQSLPTVNPLINGSGHENIPNIFIAFFSVLSELFLLLNLNPLTGYPILALGAGSLICLLSYILLRKNQVGPFFSALGALTIPYIVNSQNLAGLWYLLPFIGGIILFLTSLIALSTRDRYLAWLNGGLALLLYPPLVVFIAPVIIIDLWFDSKIKIADRLGRAFWGLLIIGGIAGLIIILQRSSFNNLANLFNSYLTYQTLDHGIPSFAPWIVVPGIILPFALLGFIRLWQKRIFWLLIPLLTGFLFWIIYSRSLYLFIIGYDRVVVITSLLIIISAAYGGDWLVSKITAKFPKLVETNFKRQIQVFCLAIFFLLAWSYTQQSNWSKLMLTVTTPNGKMLVKPLAPATLFLSEDDRQLFKKRPKRRFISPPWKGLTIGAATGLYPLDSKESILTNHILNYDFFRQQNCEEKESLAQLYDLVYVYSPKFTCKNFTELGISDEGLHLYKYKPSL